VVLPVQNTFYVHQTPPGSVFVINITVDSVTDLASWQVNLTWDPTLLNFSQIWLPPDHAFSGRSITTTLPNVKRGSVTWGCALQPGPYWTYSRTFDGTGTLCQIELKTLSPPSPPPVTCNLTLANKYFDTFLLNGSGYGISFTVENGVFTYLPARARTQLQFALDPNPACVTQTVTLLGNLTDSFGQPMNNTKIDLFVNGSFAGNLFTNSSGWFQASAKVSATGTYNITAFYYGSQNNNPSSHTEILTVYVATFKVWTDKTVYHVGETMKVSVRVRNGGTALPVRAIIAVKLPNGNLYPVLNMTTTLPANYDSGDVLWNTFTIPTAPLGNYTWIAELRNPSNGTPITESTWNWFISLAYFKNVEYTPWGLQDLNCSLDVKVDADTSDGLVKVTVEGYLRRSDYGWILSSDIGTWMINGTETEYGYISLYRDDWDWQNGRSQEGWVDVELYLFDDQGNLMDYRYDSYVAYLYSWPPE
jgi:hypothetical protein